MMRISLQAKTSTPFPVLTRERNLPLSVTIKPSNNVAGTYEYRTDTNALLQMLRRKTDLSGHVLETFRSELEMARHGKLPSVNFREETLEEIGYFID